MTKRFKPQYLPHNDDACGLVETLAAKLSLTLNAATGAKHKAILASFLYCVQKAGVGSFLDWPGGTTSQDTTGFSFFPVSGAATIKSVRAKLIAAGYITNVDDLPSGLAEWSNKEAYRPRASRTHQASQHISH